MWLFAGLGNIGREYAGTRHNVGFEVVELVEQKMERSSGWRAGKGEYYFAKGWRGSHDRSSAEEILLIKPTTYMNLSGRAVRDAMQFYKVPISNVVVIADDLAIPMGALRLRLSGSDGGHNGLTSIIYELGTEDFPRLRCGIGSNFRRGDQVNYVLSRFKPDEIEMAQEMIERAAVACFEIADSGIQKAMNLVNVTAEKQ
jgi:PTH1 family peptidyl-tRNA hydrolase